MTYDIVEFKDDGIVEIKLVNIPDLSLARSLKHDNEKVVRHNTKDIVPRSDWKLPRPWLQ